ncbi:hypothetical protein [Desulfosporosinus fructosivorans]
MIEINKRERKSYEYRLWGLCRQGGGELHEACQGAWSNDNNQIIVGCALAEIGQSLKIH